MNAFLGDENCDKTWTNNDFSIDTAFPRTCNKIQSDISTRSIIWYFEYTILTFYDNALS